MITDTQDQEYLKTLTVLYVEDEEDTREQFKQFLARLAGRLITAENGAEGLAACHEHHPDIIITDIQMPVMDGLEMVQELRILDASIPIIVLTAFEQIDYLKRSINLGVNKYLSKPVNGFELRDTLLDCAHILREKMLVEAAARIDLLTGLANRREIMARFHAEKARLERNSTLLSIIIADIDHFKRVNDSFGHLAGDQVLKDVATTLASNIRAVDICGRWGGEEFILLLPETSLDDAVLVAEKLRVAVSSITSIWKNSAIRTTISLGVGMLLPGMDIEESTDLVDKALYRAKKGGRNRVEVA